MADDDEGWAGQNKHRWNPEAENTVCKGSRRERTFSDVTIPQEIKEVRNVEVITSISV